MDTEQLRDQSAFITHRELVRTQDELRKELVGKIEGSNRRLDDVDDKVDHLRDLVLPLLETSRATEKNTERMANGFEDFAKSQRLTNGNVYDKLSAHDVLLERINVSSGANAEVKKANATVIVAIIGGVTTLIASLFALAPIIFK